MLLGKAVRFTARIAGCIILPSEFRYFLKVSVPCIIHTVVAFWYVESEQYCNNTADKTLRNTYLLLEFVVKSRKQYRVKSAN